MPDKTGPPEFALIVVDMLNDFLDEWPSAQRKRLCDSTRQLVQMMRDHHQPIVWVRQEFDPDLTDAFPEIKAKGIRITIRGTLGSEIVPELAVAPSDAVIVKKRYSAFFGTTLDVLLERLNPQTLIVAGINTHACIRMTVLDAYQRDRNVILAADCTDSYDRQHHEISIEYLRDKIAEVMTNEDIQRILIRGKS
ncbi:MAG TPA: isochorismatase family cysteine hydrolase [Candidatus Dormibacteraeota bacterium]|nr:isochorismatase family cysteine hydrolase [Candidatus Dormibacteraeota bacterium]